MMVATMSVVMFGGMCRLDDSLGLLWFNIRFESDESAFEITFDKRKNVRFRQGNKFFVASSPLAAVGPVRLLRELQIFTGVAVDWHVFRGFNGRPVSKSQHSTTPGPKNITCDVFLRFLRIWFGGVMSVSDVSFRKQLATQFGRSGVASAASNVSVPAELWGHHKD
jgi:hypothetical protein